MDTSQVLYGLIVLCLILLLWVGFVTYQFFSIKRFLIQFTDGVTKKDLRSLLDNIAHSFKEVGQEITTLNKSVEVIEHGNIFHYQKMGFIRYNPFADTGGDQSFCLCLLDKNNSGIVITSLHSREQTRIYAKAVSKGKAAGYEFAKEEQEAVAIAMKKGSKK